MPYRIPIGTPVVPFASRKKQMGSTRMSTAEAVFETGEILDQPEVTDPTTGLTKNYYRLALGDNPTDFDSYLVETGKVEEV